MLYHCGLLDEQPERSRTLQWVKRGRWNSEGFPPDVRRELAIWLAMPGFSVAYHRHTLGQCSEVIRPYQDDFEQWKAEVAENWLSATREDCVQLARLKSGRGNVPLLSQLQAVKDLKHVSTAQVAREYEVSPDTVRSWRDGHFSNTGRLPVGFSLLHV